MHRCEILWARRVKSQNACSEGGQPQTHGLCVHGPLPGAGTVIFAPASANVAYYIEFMPQGPELRHAHRQITTHDDATRTA